MNKKEFLNSLRVELKKIKCKDIDNIIEYYDELIEDKLEKNKKLSEEEVLNDFRITDIIKDINIEEKFNKAKEKPSLSNGFKALFAILSVFSLPILIPVGFVIVGLIICILGVLISMIIAVGCVIVSLFVAIPYFAVNMPIGSTIFFIGLAIVIICLLILAIKGLIKTTKRFVIFVANRIKNKKRNEVK